MMEQKIIMPEIGFDMPITDLVLELEKLRYILWFLCKSKTFSICLKVLVLLV